MDALTGLLDGPRARGAFLLRAVLEPPWSLRTQDHAPLTLIALLRGEAWVGPVGGDAVGCAPGTSRSCPAPITTGSRTIRPRRHR